jgi:haloacetate dehalogenase
MHHAIFKYHATHGPIEIAYLQEGVGPPLLLLHGFPQTKKIWEPIVQLLKSQFTCITPDLRGYGFSSKPPGLPDHANYSKREMARDMLELMHSLGHRTFDLVGHDRGGRVAHRLATDYPSAIRKIMVLDISPTWKMYANTTQQFATAYWHWFFLIQPTPIPETLIGNQVDFLLPKMMGAKAGIQNPFSPEAFKEYVYWMKDPACLHAMCEDYRAASTIDLIHDQEFRDLGKKLVMPICALWGEKGVVHRCFNPISDWQEVFQEVTGHHLPSGHYIPEDIPDILANEIRTFF